MSSTFGPWRDGALRHDFNFHGVDTVSLRKITTNSFEDGSSWQHMIILLTDQFGNEATITCYTENNKSLTLIVDNSPPKAETVPVDDEPIVDLY